MSKKDFTKPTVNVIHFKSEVLVASSCGCFDSDFCPINYNNCTSDGASCRCSINYNPQMDNCSPCPTFQ